METKREEIDLTFWSNGATLDKGLKLLRSIINELIRKLTKKFEIAMKATGSNTSYVFKIFDEKTKTKEFLCRYKSIDFEKELRHHSWKPKSQAHKKQKKRSSRILYYTKKSSSSILRKSDPVQQQQAASYR